MKSRRKRIPRGNTKSEKMVDITNEELKNSLKGSKAVLKSHNKPKKYSQTFHEYMESAINDTIHDEKSVKDVLNWSVFIWNYVVAKAFPNDTKSKDLITLYPLFKSTLKDQKFLSYHLERKIRYFGEDNFLIIKHTFLLDDEGRLSLSVAVLPMDE